MISVCLQEGFLNFQDWGNTKMDNFIIFIYQVPWFSKRKNNTFNIKKGIEKFKPIRFVLLNRLNIKDI